MTISSKYTVRELPPQEDLEKFKVIVKGIEGEFVPRPYEPSPNPAFLRARNIYIRFRDNNNPYQHGYTWSKLLGLLEMLGMPDENNETREAQELFVMIDDVRQRVKKENCEYR